jgi:hypothetical protein
MVLIYLSPASDGKSNFGARCIKVVKADWYQKMINNLESNFSDKQTTGKLNRAKSNIIKSKAPIECESQLTPIQNRTAITEYGELKFTVIENNPSTWSAKQWVALLKPQRTQLQEKVRKKLRAAIQPTAKLCFESLAVDDFAERLQLPDFPEGQYLWQRLTKELRDVIQADLKQGSGRLSEWAARSLVEEINRVVLGRPLWEEEAFKKTKCRNQTRRLRDQRTTDWANRALIEDTFPSCVAPEGAYIIPREILSAEKSAMKELTELNAAVRSEWERLLLDPDFHNVLEKGDKKKALKICQGLFGLQPPTVFNIRVWCEMRAKTRDGEKLLSILSDTKYLWRGRPGIDNEPLVRRQKTQSTAREQANEEIRQGSKLKHLNHWTKRELRKGKLAALMLAYFETLQVPRVLLVKAFNFSEDALNSLSVIGRLMAEDAEIILGKKEPAKLRKGRGRKGETEYHDQVVKYFNLALAEPGLSAREVVTRCNEPFSNTNRRYAERMINLAVKTRAHLKGKIG